MQVESFCNAIINGKRKISHYNVQLQVQRTYNRLQETDAGLVHYIQGSQHPKPGMCEL